MKLYNMTVPTLYTVPKQGYYLTKTQIIYKSCRDEFLERYVKGCTRNDSIRNDMIINDLGLFSVNARIEKCKLRWIEHIGLSLIHI